MNSPENSDEQPKTEISKLMKSKNNYESKRKKEGTVYTRTHNDEVNPCVRESMMSFQCLEDNGYMREKCDRYFRNYKNCREFWSHIVKERKRAGIKPYLPPFEEREDVRKTYLNTMS